MWSKLSLHAKITLLTALTLVSVCVILTAISFYNLQTTVVSPIVSTIVISKIDRTDQVFETEPGDNQVKYGIASAMSQDQIQNSRKDFMLYGIITMIALIIIGTALSFYLSGKALKPITVLADRIAVIDENNLETKIGTTGGSSEVSRLTHSFNSMLDKLSLAFETQKRFAQNAAHELKTPLAGIMTNIEVLQLDEVPTEEEYKEVIKLTKENTERLIDLVQNLLMLNHSLDEKNITTLYVRTMFEQIIADLQADISVKGITVCIDGDILLMGDKYLLERAFFNLVQNAVKYNKINGCINISAQKNSVTIEDTGIGIPKDCLPHIFESFYCVDKSRSRSLGGSGLGLAITKQIFDLHNMMISVESEPGKYTKVIVTV
jgi:Signal transduction histidine kinase